MTPWAGQEAAKPKVHPWQAVPSPKAKPHVPPIPEEGVQVSPFIPPKYEMPVREVTLAGNWVTLVPLRPEHIRYLYPDALEPGLFQYLEPGADGGLRYLREWIERRVEETKRGEGLAFLQVDPTKKKAFGCTAITSISRRHHRAEIGHTWISKSHRRTPANTEAKLLLLTHLFEEMGAIRVQFKADTRNEAAVRSLHRLGAVFEGTMRNERILMDGFIRDAYVFSIIRSEWPDVKKHLNGLLWARPEAAADLEGQLP